MRVLLDENIDRLLKSLFDPAFQVLTVRERGWHGKTNGELLRAAEQEFDAFVTMDRNLEFQQNLNALKLGVVIMRAPSNAYAVIAPLMPQLNAALHAIKPGTAMHVPA
jgi:predicted nuclease of predicted toxin-antitoxin system